MPELKINLFRSNFSIMKPPVLSLYLMLLFIGCTTDPQHTDEASFSDLTPLSGKVFVAYPSPDRSIKPDTVIFSWKMTGIDLQKVRIDAKIDSEPILEVPVSGSVENSRARIHWVPGNTPTAFNYFGGKKCVFVLSVQDQELTAASDTFTIIGTIPVILLSPSAGEHFSLNDSIPVYYQTNADLTSNIRVFFRNDSMPNWIEISSATNRVSDEPPLRSFTTGFYPRDWESDLSAHPSLPIRFFLKDYNSPLPNSSCTSGDIFIN